MRSCSFIRRLHGGLPVVPDSEKDHFNEGIVEMNKLEGVANFVKRLLSSNAGIRAYAESAGLRIHWECT
jgi:hypothetical protein